MGAEARLRQLHRAAIRKEYPRALVVGQPANGWTGPGRHDLYVVVAGRYVGLEVKTSMGRATPVQRDRIRLTREAGGWADVVRHPDESLRLIRHALAGGSVWDNLFDDTEKIEVTPGQVADIRAFKEPEVQKQVEYNGIAPMGEGVMLKPPDDYPFAVIVQRLDRITAMLARIMQESGITEGEAPPPAEERAAPSPAPPSRSRSKKKP